MILLEISVILGLIVVNALLSLSEIALASARRPLLREWAAEGRRGAVHAAWLAEHPEVYLSTVQLGITLIGIVAGAYGGATVARSVGPVLEGVPWLRGRGEAVALVLVVAVVIWLTIVLGELVPKRLALSSPERVACAAAGPMRLLARLAAPLVRLLGLSSDLLLRLARVSPVSPAPVTEEEIKVMLEQGAVAGAVQPEEREMIERIFGLDELRVAAVMTPRNEIVWLNLRADPAVIQEQVAEERHTRYLLGDGSLDAVLGVVHSEDMVVTVLRGEPLDLRGLARAPVFVPESMRALRLLERFRQSASHVAVVVDEFGAVAGLVTLTDLMESIVGEVPSEPEQPESLAVLRPDGTWLVDGALPLEEFKRIFRLRRLPAEAAYAHTVGGLTTACLGHIPRVAERFECEGVQVEVVDVDGHRVDRVLVGPVSPS